ncbi:6-bladed beta-propeller domain-containing protein [Phthorimaea operculella]|nr:6-bladed beta-propeller domain-containing protein [Phthorimaea operculella]
MAEKLKKKPGLSFVLKRWNNNNDEPSTPKSPSVPPSPSHLTKSNGSRDAFPVKPRALSLGGISDLVQCSLCLEVLHNPKMLPCQHTFCMACLTVYTADVPVLECPICLTKIQVTGSNFINDLPSNLYIDSLLQLVGQNEEPKTKQLTPPVTNGGQNVDLFAGGVRCSHCKTICDSSDTTACEHCKLSFCRLCWSQHLDDMRTQIGSILKQLDSAATRLDHKIEHYKDCCERITAQINQTADEKINAIIESKNSLLYEASQLQKAGDMSALALKTTLEDARAVATRTMSSNNNMPDKEQVKTFVNLHQNALQILSEVSKWDAESLIFDKENFRIEKDTATPTEAESDDPLPECGNKNEPLESEDSLVLHYRSRNFVPHYVWRKTARPGGVGIGPWDNHLYVCGMDSHCVLVVERSHAKIVSRLTCEDMLCPVHIAFMKSAGEIYVTDKWKHCVHVFSKGGEYIRSFGHKGGKVGSFRSPEGIAVDNANNLVYVVDTGNDRVQVLTPEGKFVDQIGVATKLQASNSSSVWETKEVTCTELNCPTSVAVTKDRVVVLDGGNRRIKVTCTELNCPTSVAVTKDRVVVLDGGNRRIKVSNVWETIGHLHRLNCPTSVAVTKDRVVVLDGGNRRIKVTSVWETKEVTCTELNCPSPTSVAVTKDRVVVLDGGNRRIKVTCTVLNCLTSVAVTKDRVVVLDGGNRRIKVYNKHDKNKITEFGALGQRKGQFRQPEVLTVDPMGFILVGDSGNCRVQVFKPNGQLVRVFGGLGVEPGKFGWISGIFVTKQLDVIISDTKNRSVSFF